MSRGLLLSKCLIKYSCALALVVVPSSVRAGEGFSFLLTPFVLLLRIRRALCAAHRLYFDPAKWQNRPS